MYPKCRCYIWLNPVVVLLTCLLLWMAYSSLQLFPNEREPEKVIISLYTFQQIFSFMSISDKERSTRVRKFGYLRIRENLIVM